MARDLRGIVLVLALVVIASLLIAVPQIRFSVLNFDFERGHEDAFLGLSLGLDLQGGTHLVYKVITDDGNPPSAEDMDVIRTIVERRVNEFGVSEPIVQALGNPPDKILIQIPGQSESSLTVAFEGTTVTPDQIKQFFSEDVQKNGVEIAENEDGSMTIRFEDFDGADAEDWRQMAEAEFPTTMRAAFAYEIVEPPLVPSVTETAASLDEDESNTDAEDAKSEVATAEDDAQAEDAESEADEPEEEQPTRIGPEVEDVQAAFDAAGFGDVTVGEGTDTILFTTGDAGGFQQIDAVLFEGQYDGRLIERAFDEAGGIIPSDVENLRRELTKVGDLASIRTIGNITQWTLAGGVQEAKALIGSTAQLEFRERKCGPIIQPADYEGDAWPPDGLSDTEWLLLRCSDPQYFVEQSTNISAEDLQDAFPSIEGTPPAPVVTIVFNDSGRDAFFEVTGRVARNRDILAIYLDNVELVAPTVNTPGGEGIPDGRAIISGGDFTPERVRTLSIQLRSGALPAEMELAEERNVDAILGADSLKRSMIAGGIGLVLLVIFMISYYKLPGIVASISLLAYTVMLIGIFKVVPVTLTLSGAAAVILSLGFAVDANILISERAKEELRAGRDLLSALNAGFDRAWPSIRDGNFSTIITAMVLFWFGDRFSTSIMQGFALTLGIGVLLSMFTAFFASRLMLRLAARTPIGKSSSMFVPVADNASAEGGA